MAIVFNSGNEYHDHLDGNIGTQREGIFFREELLHSRNPHNSPNFDRPDIWASTDDFPACNMQEEIDAITKWTVAYVDVHDSKGMSLHWPAKGTWPNWPDVMVDGEVIRCCSDARAAKRSSQPKSKPQFFVM